MDAKVRIVEFAETPVAVLEHRGDPARIDESVGRFIVWRKEACLPPSRHATFNIVYDDPAMTSPEAFRLDICCAVSGEVGVNAAGIIAKTIAGGCCAVLRCRDADESLRAAFSYLYDEWLPVSGKKLRDAPVFLQRFPEAMDDPAVVDIFLPLI